MKIIIYDRDKKYEEAVRKRFVKENEEVEMISDDGTIRNCIGCFNCWVKTPGQCVLKDHYNNMGPLFGRADELVIISECRYGTYSPFVRNVLDRCLSYISPDFTKRNGGEMHHKARYSNRVHMDVHFYGECEEQEKETARKTVRANGVNFLSEDETVTFYNSMEEIINENNAD